MTIADGIKKLVSMGMTLDQAVEAARVFEEAPADARKERNRRYYEAHKEERKASEKRLKASYSDRDGQHLKPSEKRLNSDAFPRARVEDKPLSTEIEPQEEGKEEKTREATPKQILMSVLDEETADAVIRHRRTKKAPLSTPLAARGLVKAFREYPGGTQAAAEMMVTNGWTGFKREYWDRQQARGSPPLRGLAAVEENFRRDLANGKYSDGEAEGADASLFEGIPRRGFDHH